MSRFSIPHVFGLASAFVQAQWIKQPTLGIPRTADGKPDLTAPAPHTPDGKPDLSGLWTFRAARRGLEPAQTVRDSTLG
jgi:hypothetical protein